MRYSDKQDVFVVVCYINKVDLTSQNPELGSCYSSSQVKSPLFI